MSQLADVQSHADDRDIAIDRVGVRRLKYPFTFADKGAQPQHCVGEFSLSVALPAERKGTHMSRFIESLEAHQDDFSLGNMQDFMHTLAERLHAQEAHCCVDFTYFRTKAAPKSGAKSKMDYQVSIDCTYRNTGCETIVQVEVPVKTLCPASKKMSDYGAHNQRAYITVEAHITDAHAQLEDIILAVEAQASAELFATLKRDDEKFITESAYDNPKFVEDLVRDLALSIRALRGIGAFSVECENLESIHNHSAFAYIECN